jgi:hypothetical protein
VPMNRSLSVFNLINVGATKNYAATNRYGQVERDF